MSRADLLLVTRPVDVMGYACRLRAERCLDLALAQALHWPELVSARLTDPEGNRWCWRRQEGN